MTHISTSSASTSSADFNARIDFELSDVRSRILDLRTESINLATDLLAVLGPLERGMASAILETTEGSYAPEVIELRRTFDDSFPAVLELSEAQAASQSTVLDLTAISSR